jgi:uncharacterized delta-60 repeat protein
VRIILQTAVVGLLLILAGCAEQDNPVGDGEGSSTRAWEKVFGTAGDDHGYSVAVTDDGGYVVVGCTEPYGNSNTDVYLIRTNSFGDTLWTETYDAGESEAGYSVAVTSDGGFVIAGYTQSIGSAEADVYLIRTNAVGDTLWTRTYGGSGNDFGRGVRVTSDGGYLIIGTTTSYGAGGVDVYLIRTNNDGDTVWTRTFGGDQSDYGESLALAGDGGYVVAGHTNSYGAGDIDVYVIKTDGAGDTVWTRTYGGGSWDYGHAIAATSDSGFVIVGRTESFGNGPDVYVVKIDAAGDTLWTRTYGGTSIDRGYAVATTNDGGCCVAGFTMSTPTGFADAYIIKINASGTTVWTRTVGGDLGETAQSVAPTGDGGCIVAGYTDSFGAGLSDVYLVKLDAGGNLPIE